jgi:hypothetical protein
VSIKVRLTAKHQQKNAKKLKCENIDTLKKGIMPHLRLLDIQCLQTYNHSINHSITLHNYIKT